MDRVNGGTAVTVEGLRYAYRRGAAPAVRELSFEIAVGEVMGFLGPSGAGKSTTQRILTRLLHGWAGEARVLGRDLRDWRDDYYERVGVSFELPNHHRRLTGLENLRLFASLYGGGTEDPMTLLEAVDLGAAAGVRVADYSKGMAMRLNLARALLPRPELLFLDEPTSGLDPVTTRLVLDLVRAQRDRGCTVFLTTHDMAVADALCDRVAFVVDGAIAAIGAPRDLRLRLGERRVAVDVRDGATTTTHRFPLDGLGDDDGFLALLRSGAVETIHSEEGSLADVFVAVTGRGLG